MNKKLLLIAFFTAFFTQITYGQWTIGDIAFTGYQADNAGNPDGSQDEFTFVLLRDVAIGEQISFTENGWFAAGGFRTGESTLTLEFTSAFTCGTQISITSIPFAAVEDGGGTSPGNLTGSGLSLSTSGDQIFAYDPGNIPDAADDSGFIAAIQMNGNWDADATGNTSSAQPAIFASNPNTAIVITSEVDNAVYNCIDLEDDDVSVLRAVIHDESNWNVNNTTPFDQPACGAFSCTTLSNDEFTTNDKEFSIFPNPSNGNITIKNRGIAIQNITITDINGKVIENREYNAIKTSVDFNLNLTTGVYFITLTSNDASTTKKLIIN